MLEQHVTRTSVNMFDALDVKLKHTPQAGLIDALCKGEYEDFVECKECGTTSAKRNHLAWKVLLAIRSAFGNT